MEKIGQGSGAKGERLLPTGDGAVEEVRGCGHAEDWW